MTETPAPLKAGKRKPRRMTKRATRRTLVKILPLAAARLGALLHDEGEVGLKLAMGELCEGTTNTYLPALKDVLLAVIEEQNWPFYRDVEAMWIDYSLLKPLNVSKGPQPRRLTCHIYDNSPYDLTEEGGLELEILSTGLRLSFSQYEGTEVTVACPRLILDRLLSGQ